MNIKFQFTIIGMVLLTVSALFITDAQAATWYVRQSCANNGNGSASACAASAGGAGAWKGFSNIVWGSVKPGDIVNLVAGETYIAPLSIGASGIAGTPIIITVSGSGAATIDVQNGGGPGINFSGRQYVIVDGGTGQATIGNTAYGLRVINIGPTTYCAYENAGGGNIKLLRIECTGSGQTEPDDNRGGFYLQAGNRGGVEAAYNWIHGPSPAAKWYGTCVSLWSDTGTSSYTDNLVHDNQCENMYNDGIRGSANVSIYNNVVKHVDGSGHSDSLLCQSGNYCAIYNNYIEGSGDQNIYLDNLYDSACGHIRIYNNVINSNPGFGVVIDPEGGAGAGCQTAATGSTWDDVVVANNTFYSTSAFAIGAGGRGKVTNLVLKNNIFGTVTDGGYRAVWLYSPAVSFADASAWDYNIYSTSSVNYPSIAMWGPFYTLAQLQALSPAREAHAILGIPSYANTPAGDYHLASNDTVARGKGANLTSLYPFLSLDKAGISRPAAGAWDLGAFQTPAGNTIYIAQNQAGSGDGSSCANAKPVTFFNTASNWGAGAGQIGPGSTVHLCGVISSELTARGSGSSGNPITILFENDAKVSLPACSNRDVNGCLNISNRNYLIVDGGTNGIIENTDNGSALGHQTASVGVLAVGSSNSEIKDLTIKNTYVFSSPTDNTDLSRSAAIYLGGDVSNLRIHDNVLHDCNWCINYQFGVSASGFSIYNNEIYNAEHGIAFGGYGGGTLSGAKIFGNYIHDYANWDVDSGSRHHDGIHFYANAGSLIDGADIYNNSFGGDPGVSLTSHIYIENNANNVRVYNNVVLPGPANRSTNFGLMAFGPNAGTLVYNNTIICGSKAGGYGALFSGGDTVFKNNVVAGCFSAIAFYRDSPGVTLDFNTYADSTYIGNYLYNATRFPVFSTWRTATGQDPNSQVVSSAAISMTTGRPLSGSPTIGAASNLTGLGFVFLNADKEGTARPVSGAWDAGAYRYTVSVILYGDVSENGSVTAYDASLAAQYAVGSILLTSSQVIKADVSCNGSVSSYDASLIAQYAVGLITTLGCG